MSTPNHLLWTDPETGQALEIAIDADPAFIAELCSAGFIEAPTPAGEPADPAAAA